MVAHNAACSYSAAANQNSTGSTSKNLEWQAYPATAIRNLDNLLVRKLNIRYALQLSVKNRCSQHCGVPCVSHLIKDVTRSTSRATSKAGNQQTECGQDYWVETEVT